MHKYLQVFKKVYNKKKMKKIKRKMKVRQRKNELSQLKNIKVMTLIQTLLVFFSLNMMKSDFKREKKEKLRK